jgi:hypothetical protein
MKERLMARHSNEYKWGDDALGEESLLYDAIPISPIVLLAVRNLLGGAAYGSFTANSSYPGLIMIVVGAALLVAAGVRG